MVLIGIRDKFCLWFLAKAGKIYKSVKITTSELKKLYAAAPLLKHYRTGLQKKNNVHISMCIWLLEECGRAEWRTAYKAEAGVPLTKVTRLWVCNHTMRTESMCNTTCTLREGSDGLKRQSSISRGTGSWVKAREGEERFRSMFSFSILFLGLF